MPRVGSREWNRQQNLRRQREQEQVVEATIVIQQAEQVVVEAEPLECRRDIQQLREQIQNKIHQIEQLKTNTKELKKLNKALNTENKKMGEKIMELTTQIQTAKSMVDDVGGVIQDLDNNGYLIDRTIDYVYKFRMTSVDTKKLNKKEKSMFEEWKAKGNSGEALSFTLNDGNSQNKKIVQEYIRYLETLVMSNTNTMESVSKGFDFKTYMLKYKGDGNKFRSDISESEGNKSDEVEYPVCVICKGLCDNEYGNNPYPVKKSGVCCDKCNSNVVMPARMGMEVELHDGFVVLKKKK